MNINEYTPAEEYPPTRLRRLENRIAELEAERDALKVALETEQRRDAAIRAVYMDASYGDITQDFCERMEAAIGGGGRDFVPRAVADKLAGACSMIEKWMEMDNFDDEEIEELTLQTVGQEVESALAEYRNTQ